ncbi:MAG: carbamoyl-phosphate synthase large subunit [Gammaproteobacteria bacterium]|nr:carbamoyl-phosphate synthase large subunit [Gammaproteobacteria bacterium]
MSSVVTSVDQLYLKAEALSQDFSLFPRKEPSSVIAGLLTHQQIESALENLRGMEVDEYIAATVAPTEESKRQGSKQIIKSLGLPISNEEEEGPLYCAEVEFDIENGPRRFGFITQNREYNSGVWGPVHHNRAANIASQYAERSLPIITMMDTPGADSYEEANAGNQAHSISRLIAELCNVDVPTLGIIIGQGYSGGAIPLAASNLLFSLRTGVFNTIHPKGLASLVRRYNLSWQECAKSLGVSSYELYKQGNIDGVIDFDPGETENVKNLVNVIFDGISSIEKSTKEFVADHPEVLEHYKRNIARYLNQSESQELINAGSALKLRAFPTEYPNIFGVAFRYLRYLGLRRKIKSTTITQYGRLAGAELPEGELAERTHRERRTAFLSWLQDPDKILYEDVLNKAWKNFLDRRDALGEERGRLAQLIFGEPQANFSSSVKELCLVCGLHLYNRWKANAKDNLSALIQYLENPETKRYFLNGTHIKDVKGLLKALSRSDDGFRKELKQRFTFEGKKLFDLSYIDEKNEASLKSQLVPELNMILEGDSLYTANRMADLVIPSALTKLATSDKHSLIEVNRIMLEETLWSHIERNEENSEEKSIQDTDVVDIISNEDVREQFIETCRNLVLFDRAYENMISNLVSMAREANETRKIPAEFVEKLLQKSIQEVMDLNAFESISEAEIQQSFSEWMQELASYAGSGSFLKSVEEWIRVVHKDKSDTLFVVVSFFFEKILPDYYLSTKSGKKFEGRIEPVRIGRRKDFWNRLTIAYRDLLFNEMLNEENRSLRMSYKTILKKFVENFVEINETLMSSNPCSFPTFRPSIESALNSGTKPYGLITGVGDFITENGCYRAGLVLSNVSFQAGSIDNSDCARFCNLLVECAVQRLPIICFISSGGMQTKEGAAALFTMAVVNDRITRFVRDNDLPIIVFGFGHCTGGAQASFVTHPLVQTYYLTGARMPFAGQAVVERNLPYNCMLSNYLSLTAGAMAGLVQHPFSESHDADLRNIDPDIPLPTESVEQVVDRVMAGILVAQSPLVRKNVPKEEDLFRPVDRTLIHARGCTAVNLVVRAKELGKSIVLIQSDPDMDSFAADLIRGDPKHSLVCIGGNTSDESYLNALSVISIAESEKVDSLHPGIGFLSEDPNFAYLVRQKGINFIGPPVASMETMGNKSNAINTTMAIDVPVVPGSHGIVDNSERAAEISEQIGYPVMLKAVHGGGGKGIQIVEKPEQLHRLFHQVSTEARAAFGNGDLYIEKFVTSLRHIEAQLLRDRFGNTKVIGIRDCSVQRNNQKIMEESGSVLLSKELNSALRSYAAKIGDSVDYVGVGTVEFIHDLPNNAVYFMEMNTRLQVEHPVTETVTGVNIVEKQFQISEGESIKDIKYREKGYALEVRVNAEKLVIDAEGKVSFQPTPGEVSKFFLPDQSGVRAISMISEGKVVPPFYDSLILQVISYGRNRKDSVKKMLSYLEGVIINGISTNIPLIKRILEDKVFLSGEYDTSYLANFLERTDFEGLAAEIEEASGSISEAVNLEMLKIPGSNEFRVLSPSAGIFYRAPSPSEPEYVNEGDVISSEDILCQLEAMKMFTPISLKSFSNEGKTVYADDQGYEITRINMTNGQQVNENDLLFIIQPHELQAAEKE